MFNAMSGLFVGVVIDNGFYGGFQFL